MAMIQMLRRHVPHRLLRSDWSGFTAEEGIELPIVLRDHTG